MKVCSKCKVSKSVEAFYTHRNYADGRKGVCKACEKEYAKKHIKSLRARYPEKYKAAAWRRTLKRQYGLTVLQFEEMGRLQNNKCACCGDELKSGKSRAVDHCHKTGAVRGRLCARCNIGLGCFLDSPRRLRLAAEYLDRFEYLSVLF